MDADTSIEHVPAGDKSSGDIEADVYKDGVPGSIWSSGDVMREIESACEVLTRIELDVQCSCEKLANLSILMMHVATKESELEAFITDKNHNLKDSGEKVLEFDLLSGVVESELSELEKFMSTLQADIATARQILPSYENLGEALKDTEEKLQDFEESLRQSLEQISDLKEQSSYFQRNLLSLEGEETWEGDRGLRLVEYCNFSDQNSMIKMKTDEEQRHVLVMLEKTMAREMDLEKRVVESREIEESLKLKLHSTEYEILCMEDEALVTLERLFEGENTAEVLMGISKELLSRLQILQFNLNCSRKREEELSEELQDSNKQLIARQASLQKIESSNTEFAEFLLSQNITLKASLAEAEDRWVVADSEAFTLRETMKEYELQLKEYELQLMNTKTSGDENEDLLHKLNEMSIIQEEFEDKISKAESRADIAEAKCKLLTETNIELNEELNHFKGSGNTSERVDYLERQLKESDILLQREVASTEASQEKQSMLESTVKDMENLIEGLKLKVVKAENQADSAEDKCIILSESNSDLNEELRFLRSRVDSLKASLHQAEEMKRATAKDIRIRTKLIADLVMQLALERERLQKQISLLMKENKILVKQLDEKSKSPGSRSHNEKVDEPCVTSTTSKSKNMVDSLNNTINVGRSDERKIGPADSASKFESARNIDARQLNVRHVAVVVLVLVISVLVASLLQILDGGSKSDSEF